MTCFYETIKASLYLNKNSEIYIYIYIRKKLKEPSRNKTPTKEYRVHNDI